MLYGAALFVDIHEAEEGFNRLQAKWARTLVAGTSTAHISGLLAAVACGWEFRFGTLVLEKIMMARARLFVLPQSSPAVILAHVAGNVSACTWVRSTAALLQSPRFRRVIPDIAICGQLAAVDISAARSDRLVRQRVLRTYRDAVVRPVLWDYDRSAFLAASAKVLVRGLLHSSWCTGFWRAPFSLVSWPATSAQDHAVRVWACLSTSGKWPMQLLGGQGFPRLLDSCAQCPAQGIDPAHALCECPATVSSFRKLCTHTVVPPRGDVPSLLRALLSASFDSGWEQKLHLIQYVSQAVRIAAGAEESSDPLSLIGFCTMARAG